MGPTFDDVERGFLDILCLEPNAELIATLARRWCRQNMSVSTRWAVEVLSLSGGLHIRVTVGEDDEQYTVPLLSNIEIMEVSLGSE